MIRMKNMKKTILENQPSVGTIRKSHVTNHPSVD